MSSRACLIAAACLTAAAAAAPPSLQPVVPPGVTRGTTEEITLSGANLGQPLGLGASFPARVTLPADRNPGKDSTKVRAKLEVPPDAPLGWHRLRLATAQGVSNFRPFCVDSLPQILEAEDNRTKEK